MKKFIYWITMLRSRKMIRDTYGVEFWNQFKELSDKVFKETLKKTPDIGKSVFSFNYSYAPSYVAWYKSMRLLNLDALQADKLMWKMNEKMLLTVPKSLLHSAGKIYLNSFRKKARDHVKRQSKGILHPYDWEINYNEIDNNCFSIEINKCGFIAFAKEFGAEGMLPGICSVDYMIAHYMGNGFQRTKTLGYGDNCCDCMYELTGKCELHPTGNMK